MTKMWSSQWAAPSPTTRSRPRLLCVMQLPPPIHGVTVVNQCVATSAALADRFEVEVLPLASAVSMQEIDRISLRKLGRMAAICTRLGRALVARRPDAVYFTLVPTGAAFYRDCVLVGIMKLAGVRRIYHLHGKGIRGRLDAPWRRALYRWVFRDAWVIHLAEGLVPDLGDLVPRGRVRVVPNGVPERSVPERGHREGRPRLLFLSNMIESKGPFVLLEALGLLRARSIPFEATFAGAEVDPRCLERFHAELHRLGLAAQVRYVGPAYGEAKHGLFEAHDAFVYPTYNDAFPLVALEAMRAGLPVVTTHEGALPEIVEDGATGRLVPPRDPTALADCLAALLADPVGLRRMGAQGRQRHEERYTLTAFERNLVAALAACTEGAA